jgi:hypothetical protein
MFGEKAQAIVGNPVFSSWRKQTINCVFRFVSERAVVD